MTKTAEQLPAVVSQVPTQVPEVTRMIERSLVDPDVPVEKMERLFVLHKEIRDEQAKIDFAAAMAQLQGLKEVIPTNREGTGPGGVKFPYADYGQTVLYATPWMRDCGLSHTHRQEPVIEGNYVVMTMVTCIISHASGHKEEFPYPAIPDPKLKDKMSPSQWIQQPITYAKRQSFAMGLGLATGEDKIDDDAIIHATPINENQVADLRAKIEEVGADEKRVLKMFKAESLEALPAQCYDDAIAKLESFGKQADRPRSGKKKTP